MPAASRRRLWHDDGAICCQPPTRATLGRSSKRRSCLLTFSACATALALHRRSSVLRWRHRFGLAAATSPVALWILPLYRERPSGLAGQSCRGVVVCGSTRPRLLRAGVGAASRPRSAGRSARERRKPKLRRALWSGWSGWSSRDGPGLPAVWVLVQAVHAVHGAPHSPERSGAVPPATYRGGLSFRGLPKWPRGAVVWYGPAISPPVGATS